MLSSVWILGTPGFPGSVFWRCPEDLETPRRAQTRMLRRAANLSELANTSLSAVNHFSDGIPGDDLTLLIVRRRDWPGIASPGEAQNL
jgi:hypothetical protein